MLINERLDKWKIERKKLAYYKRLARKTGVIQALVDRPTGKLMKLPKYCVCRSEEFRYPFNMQDLVAAGTITEAQRDKYMEMLNSIDVEMENLAIKILRKLKGYD